MTSGQDAGNAAGAPQEVSPALTLLLDRTKYPLVQENGHRRYGPPPGWEGPPPPKGCEVFVGKIPRDMFEDELVPVMERAGRLYEVRLMVDQAAANRGYGFVQYCTLPEAETALRILKDVEVRPKRYLGVSRSVDNNRLFVGGIPKTRSREEVMEEMCRATEGVVKVILYACINDRTKNRGYAFVEYTSHKAAAMARRKLFSGRLQLWGAEVKVDWAEPEHTVDKDTMAKVGAPSPALCPCPYPLPCPALPSATCPSYSPSFLPPSSPQDPPGTLVFPSLTPVFPSLSPVPLTFFPFPLPPSEGNSHTINLVTSSWER